LVLTQPCCLSAPSTWCCCCRCPCLGARIVQAHVCGRLPRDTLVAAHVPKVPSAVVSTDTLLLQVGQGCAWALLWQWHVLVLTMCVALRAGPHSGLLRLHTAGDIV
jgi:hypothetical protein